MEIESDCVLHILQIIAEHSSDSRIHGILVQLPLPKHINEEMVLGSIPYEKDVDGFHPWNAGMLAMRGRMPRFIPCTPKGESVNLLLVLPIIPNAAAEFIPGASHRRVYGAFKA